MVSLLLSFHAGELLGNLAVAASDMTVPPTRIGWLERIPFRVVGRQTRWVRAFLGHLAAFSGQVAQASDRGRFDWFNWRHFRRLEPFPEGHAEPQKYTNVSATANDGIASTTRTHAPG